jgi:hypothetical protein
MKASLDWEETCIPNACSWTRQSRAADTERQVEVERPNDIYL